MRKVNPTDVCADFQKELEALGVFYEAAVRAFKQDANAKRRTSLVSEIVFHRGYVALESFLSAYFIGCVNRDASVFWADRERRIRQSLQSKWTWDLDYMAYTPPPHPAVAHVGELLDPEERNVTFKNCTVMIQRANECLAPQHAARFTAIPEVRRAILDAARTIRDCIAHQSPVSFTRMNDCLQALPDSGNAALLKRPVNAVANVGSYLKAFQQDRRRVSIFFDEFRQLSIELA